MRAAISLGLLRTRWPCRTRARGGPPCAAPRRTRRGPRRGRSPPRDVPTTGTPAAVSRAASPSGVCPPSCTITPATVPRPLLGVHHLQHVLERQRLEVEAVGGVVVGGDGLRVAVDHHGLEPGLAQRHDRVHAGVVELDALPDPVRPRAEDEHLRPLGLRRDLRLGRGVGLVGAVVVRGARGELGGAGVDGLVDRPHAQPVAQRAHTVLAGELRAQRGELAVGEARPLGPAQQRARRAPARRGSRRRSSTSRAIWSRNHGSMPERRGDLATGTPARSAARRRRSARRSAWRRRVAVGVGPSGSGMVQNPPPWSPSSAAPCPAPRGTSGPSAIASPTLFIVVVSSGSAPGNFSNANRGTFTTT